MTHLKFKKIAALCLAAVSQLSSPVAMAAAGGGGTGGGDLYVVDFVTTATQTIYPWLKAHGNSLKPKVNATDFLMAMDPRGIVSASHVFESCDGSRTGREVDACYNADKDQITLSRTRYPINSDSPDKLKLIAHEVFRKMRIEGDQYEIVRQISIFNNPTPPHTTPAKQWRCELFVPSIIPGNKRFWGVSSSKDEAISQATFSCASYFSLLYCKSQTEINNGAYLTCL